MKRMPKCNQLQLGAKRRDDKKTLELLTVAFTPFIYATVAERENCDDTTTLLTPLTLLSSCFNDPIAVH